MVTGKGREECLTSDSTVVYILQIGICTNILYRLYCESGRMLIQLLCMSPEMKEKEF